MMALDSGEVPNRLKRRVQKLVDDAIAKLSPNTTLAFYIRQNKPVLNELVRKSLCAVLDHWHDEFEGRAAEHTGSGEGDVWAALDDAADHVNTMSCNILNEGALDD
jgi:hypothetical protein